MAAGRSTVEIGDVERVYRDMYMEGCMLKQVRRDGALIWKLKCPGCGTWGEIDDDQLNGRVSTWCSCGYHKTIDWRKKQQYAMSHMPPPI